MSLFLCISSVQFSHSAVYDSLRPYETQHARPPCPSPTPGVHPNPCPSSWWCHPTILSSVIPFSSCPQSFPDQGLFKWVSSSHQVAKVLGFQLQHQLCMVLDNLHSFTCSCPIFPEKLFEETIFSQLYTLASFAKG